MLFGMFFGAGNLIFPVLMGQMSGQNVWVASIGFLITGVSIPLLAVAALGKTRTNGLFDLGQRINRPYSLIFTLLLYLTIGPFFAIPRCATVSFSVGIEPMIEGGGKLALVIFSLCFFLAAAYFSLRPSRILDNIGKVLNPIFLVFLAILIIRALVSPMGAISDIQPSGAYIDGSFVTGFYEGYNTMDAIAGLAFGIVVVNVIKGLGIERGEDVASETIKSGIFSCVFMGLIYLALAIVGAQSRGLMDICANGGEALYMISNHYFGTVGSIILAIIVTLACLKTSVGLIVSCAEAFREMFPKSCSEKVWSIIFLALSFLIANLGLNQIISLSIPVLMLLYPLSIVLILLALFENLFGGDRLVYSLTIYFTIPVSIIEFIVSAPFGEGVISAASSVRNMLPLGSTGLGWICPAALGCIIGLICKAARKKA